MWRNLKIISCVLLADAIWAFGIAPRVLYLGVVPIVLISALVGGVSSYIGCKVKLHCDAEDEHIRRYQRKLVREMQNILEEDKLGY